MPKHTSLAYVFEPLLSLPQLEHVDIKYGWMSSLADDDVLSFARAWPLVKFLVLKGYDYVEPFPTQSALSHFVQHCPRLLHLTLGMPLNIQVPLELPGSSDSLTPRSHPLVSLQLLITTWDVEEIPPEELARLLDGLFPNLHLNERSQDKLFADRAGLSTAETKMLERIQALQEERRAGRR